MAEMKTLALYMTVAALSLALTACDLAVIPATASFGYCPPPRSCYYPGGYSSYAYVPRPPVYYPQISYQPTCYVRPLTYHPVAYYQGGGCSPSYYGRGRQQPRPNFGHRGGYCRRR